MRISRHYLTVEGRCVHYRRCGEGPPVLLVHQSPLSSAEYEATMREWGHHFTCIAPDSPGFGQSDPLPLASPSTDDFGDAILAFASAVGLQAIAAYGFHSGGIFIMNAFRRHPDRFTALAVGGYPCFRPDERSDINEDYLPPMPPCAFGEHLVWAWNRIVEQSWYFPWFRPGDSRRLPTPHADPDSVHRMVLDLLAAGDAYRLGYGAAFAASFDVPPAGSSVPPGLLSSYIGDPMTAHMDRFPELPNGWATAVQPTRAAHFSENADFLMQHRAPLVALEEDRHRGFVAIKAGGFDGLIHWRGTGDQLRIHAPGGSLDLIAGDGIAIDLPGHGLSDRWPDTPPTGWTAWHAIIMSVAAHFGVSEIVHEPLPAGDVERLYPDLTPDRYGHHLVTAWSTVRAAQVFAPHYDVGLANARPIDEAAMMPEQLAIAHLALIRAWPAAQALHRARQEGAAL